MNTFRKTRSGHVTDSVREMILGGALPPGSYLPAEREFVSRYGVSRVTVRRALRALVEEGLIETIPYRGYRIAPARPQVCSGGPVAYVLAQAEPEEPWDRTHEQILAALNRELISRGRNALAVGCKGRSPSQVIEEIRGTGAYGLLLDTSRPEFAEAAARSGLPCVIVDAFLEAPNADAVIQDNFNGARKAVEYLILRGRRRLAWLGPTRGNAHCRERFAGARAALFEAGTDFAPDGIAEVPHGDTEKAWEAAARLLAARERPDAIVCMWVESAMGAARAVRAAGLVAGRDVEIAGWATEREYREILAPEFIGGDVPATVVWRPEEMASLALERLDARAKNPLAPAVRVDVRTRLLEPAPAEAVLRGSLAGGKRRGE